MATIDTKTSVNTYLKNLMHYIHQNFLVAAKFLYSRIMDRRVRNVWMEKLKKLVDEKLVKQIKNKNQAVQMLRVNLQNSENIIRNIISANLRKQFFTVLNEYINRLPLFPNEKIRDVLYNIEQFKFDAMIQPELNVKSSTSRSTNSSSSSSSSSSKSNNSNTATSSKFGGGSTVSNNSMAKKMIKDSDKSSGTNNLVGTGGSNSSLTGKNPFAILKASAIAAS